MNYLMYFSEGGQASVDVGKCFGIEWPILKKSCSSIASNDGLVIGSSYKMLETNPLAYLEILRCSGKE